MLRRCATSIASAITSPRPMRRPQVPYQPALAAFALVQALLPPVHAQFYRDVPVCVSDPPPLQRFCSLLI